MRMLIVDDSFMMRAMIKRVVALADMPVEEILEAGDGAEALAILESRDVDVLLVDLNMPVMTGIELLCTLASNPRWKQLTRVVVSTDGTATRRDEAAGLEVRRYLEKPFTPEGMRDILLEVTH